MRERERKRTSGWDLQLKRDSKLTWYYWLTLFWHMCHASQARLFVWLSDLSYMTACVPMYVYWHLSLYRWFFHLHTILFFMRCFVAFSEANYPIRKLIQNIVCGINFSTSTQNHAISHFMISLTHTHIDVPPFMPV